MPSVRYRGEYCDKLVKHMAKGYTFKSFGAEVSVCKATLFNWQKKYPAFRKAHDVGECFLEKFLLELGHRISTGNLTRLEREEPIIGDDGRPIFDAEGKPVMRRFYTATKGNAASWIFTAKNTLHWKNADTVHHAGPVEGDKPVELSTKDMSLEQINERYE